MIHVRRIRSPFPLPGGLKGAVLGWLVAEVLAFAFVVHLLGLGGAILLGLATTVLGIVTLRRVGLDAARNLRRAVAGAEPANGALLDGMLRALGGLLLIVPGFIANFAGFALASPSVRRWATRLFDGNGGPVPPAVSRRSRAAPTDVIDLAPEDWRIVDRRGP